jgi:hypothetical protein
MDDGGGMITEDQDDGGSGRVVGGEPGGQSQDEGVGNETKG